MHRFVEKYMKLHWNSLCIQKEVKDHKRLKPFDPYQEINTIIKEGYRDYSVVKGELFIHLSLSGIFPKIPQPY